MGAIKDRNSKDPAEAEEIKKRWQEYREELYKKGLKDLGNHNGEVHTMVMTSWHMKSSGP